MSKVQIILFREGYRMAGSTLELCGYPQFITSAREAG